MKPIICVVPLVFSVLLVSCVKKSRYQMMRIGDNAALRLDVESGEMKYVSGTLPMGLMVPVKDLTGSLAKTGKSETTPPAETNEHKAIEMAKRANCLESGLENEWVIRQRLSKDPTVLKVHGWTVMGEVAGWSMVQFSWATSQDGKAGRAYNFAVNTENDLVRLMDRTKEDAVYDALVSSGTIAAFPLTSEQVAALQRKKGELEAKLAANESAKKNRDAVIYADPAFGRLDGASREALILSYENLGKIPKILSLEEKKDVEQSVADLQSQLDKSESLSRPSNGKSPKPTDKDGSKGDGQKEALDRLLNR